jgi:hypothetical protein
VSASSPGEGTGGTVNSYFPVGNTRRHSESASNTSIGADSVIRVNRKPKAPADQRQLDPSLNEEVGIRVLANR